MHGMSMSSSYDYNSSDDINAGKTGCMLNRQGEQRRLYSWSNKLAYEVCFDG